VPLQVPPNCDLTLGLTCVDKSTPGTSVWAMTADERFANPSGLIQGGFLGAFADSAMGACAVSCVGDRKVFVSNTQMTVSFLRPVLPGTRLTCTATTTRQGRRVIFVAARITDDTHNLVATSSSSYLVKERSE
jgi:uncharacterized protein (TIGR00369 family)